MKVLRKRIFKIVPAWVLLILLVGTVAAAFFWISNRVSISIWIMEHPIYLESRGNYVAMGYFLHEPRRHQINFTVNNPAQDIGYVVFNFTMFDAGHKWDNLSQMWMYMYLNWTGTGHGEEGIYSSGYPMLTGGNRSLIWVFERFNTTYLIADGPFNFTKYGNTGYIDYYITYDYVVPSHWVDIQITFSL